MGIWDRLGHAINSYISDYTSGFGEPPPSAKKKNSVLDPDLDKAYEELDEYLNLNKTPYKTASSSVKLPPKELRADFQYIGVPFGADAETCKEAYKRLLKIHHPDRHANHEGNFKKATENTAKINAAFERIKKWHSVSI